MNITPELIIATSGLVTALFVAWGQYRSMRLAARKDEVDLLRGEVSRLQSRVSALEEKNVKLNSDNDMLRQENSLLREEIYMLRALLKRNNIELPPSKIFPI